MLLTKLYNLLLRTSHLLPGPASKHAPSSCSPLDLLRCLSTTIQQPVSLAAQSLPAASKLDIHSSRHATGGRHERKSPFTSSPLLELPLHQGPLQPMLSCRSVHRTSILRFSSKDKSLGSSVPQLYGISRTDSRLNPSGTLNSAKFATAAGSVETDDGDYDPQPSEPSQAWDQARDRGRLLAFYSDQYRVILPSGHRFPMEKYTLTHAALRGDPSLRDCLNLQAAPLATAEELGAAHDAEFVDRFLCGDVTAPDMRAIGLPWSPSLATYCRASAGGCVAATHAVLQYNLPMAASLAGGTHHAFADRGEGFCIFNDVAIGARLAMRDYGIWRILVIDLDVHQGNGTAAIFEGDERVTTFDMHGDKNYPWKTRMTNTYDIAVHDDVEDAGYLQILSSWLPRLFKRHNPQLVFFQAGIDALKADSFGRLALTREGLLKRNNLVYSHALEAEVPLVIVMGGGYSRPIDASVDAHADVYRSAAYRVAAHHQG